MMARQPLSPHLRGTLTGELIQAAYDYCDAYRACAYEDIPALIAEICELKHAHAVCSYMASHLGPQRGNVFSAQVWRHLSKGMTQIRVGEARPARANLQ